MHPPEELAGSTRSGRRRRRPRTILYNILSGRQSGHLDAKRGVCVCERRRTVSLRDPGTTCQVASRVLVNAVGFARGLPSFRRLPPGDQSSLLRHGWVPLFVLGLAQENIAFEVTDGPASSILRRILLGPELTEEEEEAGRPTLAGLLGLRACLNRLWSLELSPHEYDHLKGALLFDPAAEGLSSSRLVEGLGQEAQRALQEAIHLPHPEGAVRLGRVLLAASAVQDVSRSLVTELFFKPVIGDANMSHLLTDMLFLR